MRANPADLKQKGARPMVDIEPAQQGQAVGVRWEAKQRLTTNGMFPPYKNTKTEPVLSINKAITRQPVDKPGPPAIQIDPPKVITDEGIFCTETVIWIAKKEFYQCTK